MCIPKHPIGTPPEMPNFFYMNLKYSAFCKNLFYFCCQLLLNTKVMLLRKVRIGKFANIYTPDSNTSRVVSVAYGRLAMPPINGRPANISLKYFVKFQFYY